MAFPGRAKAHCKTSAPFRQTVLISCRNHRRIKQRRRLHRILHREIRTDKQFSRFAQLSRWGNEAAHGLVMLKKNIANISMFFPKLNFEPSEQVRGFGLGQPTHPLDDPSGARISARVKKARNCAPGIRVDSIRQSIYGYFHRVSVIINELWA